jgi:hypothetical protein
LHSSDEFRAHLQVCRRYGVRIVVTAVGDPTLHAPLIQDAGMFHFHDATTIRFAEKAVAAGVDGIVAIGAGGGGHAGTISHLAFIPQVRAMFDGTVVMAGAVSNGAVIRAGEILGADLAYVLGLPHLRRRKPNFMFGAEDDVRNLGAQLSGYLGGVTKQRQAAAAQFHSSPSSTNSAARSRARALASVSCHSSSGTESATTPAAACT